MLATSQRADGTRSCGISSTHKPPNSKPFRSFSFVTPYQHLFLSAAQASCKLYSPPPWKWIWGKFKGSIYILFPPWFQFVVIFCWMLTRGVVLVSGRTRNGIKSPAVFSSIKRLGPAKEAHANRFHSKPHSILLFFPEGCTHTHSGILKSRRMCFGKKKTTQIPHSPTLCNGHHALHHCNNPCKRQALKDSGWLDWL